MEVLERLERIERIERIECRSWAFGYFFIFDLKKNRNTKTGPEKDIHFYCD